MYDIVIRYQDGRKACHEQNPGTIKAAVGLALDTADALGRDGGVDDPHRARSVEIWKGGDMELSVAVFAGGLLSDGAVPAGR